MGFSRRFIQTSFGAALVLLILAQQSQAAQRNSPEFKEAAYYGGQADQGSHASMGRGIALQGKRLYLTGLDLAYNPALGAQALVVRYDLPLGSSRRQVFKWPQQPTTSSPMRGIGPPEAFMSAATTPEGLYLAGWSWTQTHGDDPKKLSKAVLVKFPLDGPTGPGVGGSLWVAKSDFFKNRGWEAYLAVAAGEKEDSAFLYTAGFAHWHDAGTGSHTAVAAKYDTQGNLIWSKVLGKTEPWTQSAGQAVAVLGGHVYVSGYTRYPTYGPDTLRAVIWKLDSAGNTVWTKTCEVPPADVRNRNYPLGPVVLTASQGHLFLALTRRNAESGADTDVLLLKYDPKGNLVWKQGWGTVQDDVVLGIASHRDRIYLVGETTGSSGGEKDAFLVETDARNGEVLSPHFHGGRFEDKAWGVVATGRDLYVGGETRSFLEAGNQLGQNDLMALHYTLTFSPPAPGHPKKGRTVQEPKGLESKQAPQPQGGAGVTY